MKEFFKSPKKTAILGLIGAIIMLFPVIKFTFGEDFFEFGIISIYHTYFWGLLIYFIYIVLRFYKLKGNIKIVNYILITTIAVSIIGNILGKLWINVIVLIIFELYLLNIFCRKKTLINNKIALIVLVAYIIYSIVVNNIRTYFFVQNLFDFITQIIGYLFIIPYFYNYYNLLKGENKNGK